MTKRKIYIAMFTTLLIPFLRAVPALAVGDKVVPHVVDGSQSDGIRYRTKFDIINLSWSYPISKVTVLFFKDNGQPWTVATNQGSANAFPLNLGTAQTIRIETLGNGDVTSGFVIVRNLEATTDLPDLTRKLPVVSM